MKRYTITIQKSYGEYIVLGNDRNNGSIVTGGKTLEEAIDMLGDAMMCLEDVKVSWWNKNNATNKYSAITKPQKGITK